MNFRLHRLLSIVGGLAGIGLGLLVLYRGGGWRGWVAIAAGAVLARTLVWDTDPPRVPVVMLHSVAGFRPDRPAAFSVWCPPPMFEGYLRWMKRKGFHTITLQQLFDHLERGARLPKKPIVLTFDDGYLDNWVHAVPLLEKYGFTATVFVPSEFVQPGETPRPTLADVWAGRVREDALEVFGYMNRAELREAARRGTLDVQSHGATHTWLPVAPEVIDVHRPGMALRQLRWMWWNRNVARKPWWFHEIDEAGVPYGAPVHRNALALGTRAFLPPAALEQQLVAHVAAHGGAAFFARPDWRAEVDAIVAAHGGGGRPETDEEFRARLAGELVRSRETLEAITGKPVRFMCWPNGGTCREAFAALQPAGYLAATLPSAARQPINRRGTNPARIGRISATSFFRGTPRPGPWVFSFAAKVERNRGVGLWEIPIKAIWLWRRVVKPSGSAPPGAEEA